MWFTSLTKLPSAGDHGMHFERRKEREERRKETGEVRGGERECTDPIMMTRKTTSRSRSNVFFLRGREPLRTNKPKQRGGINDIDLLLLCNPLPLVFFLVFSSFSFALWWLHERALVWMTICLCVQPALSNVRNSNGQTGWMKKRRMTSPCNDELRNASSVAAQGQNEWDTWMRV